MTIPIIKITDSNAAKKKRACPRCKGEQRSRIPRGILVKAFLFWLPLKRYMCHKCQHKSYVWG